MEKILYFTEDVSQNVDVKTESFEEINLQHNIDSHGNILLEKDPLIFGENLMSDGIKIENIEIDQTSDPLICNICDKTFTNENELSIHNASHFNIKLEEPEQDGGEEGGGAEEKGEEEAQKYECKQCQKVFKTRSGYNIHLRTHSSQRDHICDTCGKSYHTYHRLKHHMVSHTDERKFSCKICGMKFKTSSCVRHHVLTHNTERSHICHICGKGLKKKEYLADHLRSHTGEKPYECPICYKKFVHRTALRMHKFIHNPNTFICEKCGHKYSNKKVNGVSDCPKCKPILTCEICLKKFKYLPSFMRHIKIHTGLKEHFCHICNHGFIQKAAYNSHMNSHKKKGELGGPLEKIKGKLKDMRVKVGQEEIYYCQVCEEKLKDEEDAKKHIEMHAEQSDQSESEEDKDDENDISRTTYQSHLIENYNYSNSVYQCSLCKKTFTKKEHLNKHLNDHQNENSLKKLRDRIEESKKRQNKTMRFKCDICSLRFTENEILKKHMLKCHIGGNNVVEQIRSEISIDNPLNCQKCNKQFVNQLSLQKHMEEHESSQHNETQFNPNEHFEKIDLNSEKQQIFYCQPCRMKFANQISFETHCQRHEREQTEETIEEPERRQINRRVAGISCEKFSRKKRTKYGDRKIKFVECPEIVLNQNDNETNSSEHETFFLSINSSDLITNNSTAATSPKSVTETHQSPHVPNEPQNLRLEPNEAQKNTFGPSELQSSNKTLPIRKGTSDNDLNRNDFFQTPFVNRKTFLKSSTTLQSTTSQNLVQKIRGTQPHPSANETKTTNLLQKRRKPILKKGNADLGLKQTKNQLVAAPKEPKPTIAPPKTVQKSENFSTTQNVQPEVPKSAQTLPKNAPQKVANLILPQQDKIFMHNGQLVKLALLAVEPAADAKDDPNQKKFMLAYIPVQTTQTATQNSNATIKVKAESGNQSKILNPNQIKKEAIDLADHDELSSSTLTQKMNEVWIKTENLESSKTNFKNFAQKQSGSDLNLKKANVQKVKVESVSDSVFLADNSGKSVVKENVRKQPEEVDLSEFVKNLDPSQFIVRKRKFVKVDAPNLSKVEIRKQSNEKLKKKR